MQGAGIPCTLCRWQLSLDKKWPSLARKCTCSSAVAPPGPCGPRSRFPRSAVGRMMRLILPGGAGNNEAMRLRHTEAPDQITQPTETNQSTTQPCDILKKTVRALKYPRGSR